MPELKNGDIPLYVHKLSNHPPSITKNIPAAVNKRLSTLSSSEETFKSVTRPYQEALHKAGYDHTLRFDPDCAISNENGRTRTRRRKGLWFNTPYSGQKF